MSETTAWNILIVDDEEEVHLISKMVLGSLVFRDRPVRLLGAKTGQEALDICSREDNIAVALVDVVMEKEDSGLNFVHKLRNSLENHLTRIILRTGQPGQAPEAQVVIDYDINDYKEKVELTAQKLVTSVIAALRSYSDLVTIADLNAVLERKVADRTQALRDANLKLRSYITKLESDQLAGGRMQQRLLPEADRRFGPYSFSSRLFSSMYLSGDFLDYFEIDAEHLGFYMADVSGHGISSAIVTVLLKNIMDTYLELYRRDGVDLILHPLQLASKINLEILKEDLGKYLTFFYGIIEKENGRVSFCNCGQFPYPISLNQGKDRPLEESGTPLGLFARPEFAAGETLLSEHGSLLIVSDGILEFMKGESIEEKQEQLLTLFDGDKPCIETALQRLGLDQPAALPDDITVLLIQREVTGG